MRYYDTSDPGRAAPSDLSARGQRARGLWLWFWSALAAILVFLGITLARGAAAVLVSGFLPHSHP